MRNIGSSRNSNQRNCHAKDSFRDGEGSPRSSGSSSRSGSGNSNRSSTATGSSSSSSSSSSSPPSYSSSTSSRSSSPVSATKAQMAARALSFVTNNAPERPSSAAADATTPAERFPTSTSKATMATTATAATTASAELVDLSDLLDDSSEDDKKYISRKRRRELAAIVALSSSSSSAKQRPHKRVKEEEASVRSSILPLGALSSSCTTATTTAQTSVKRESCQDQKQRPIIKRDSSSMNAQSDDKDHRETTMYHSLEQLSIGQQQQRVQGQQRGWQEKQLQRIPAQVQGQVRFKKEEASYPILEENEYNKENIEQDIVLQENTTMKGKEDQMRDLHMFKQDDDSIKDGKEGLSSDSVSSKPLRNSRVLRDPNELPASKRARTIGGTRLFGSTNKNKDPANLTHFTVPTSRCFAVVEGITLNNSNPREYFDDILFEGESDCFPQVGRMREIVDKEAKPGPWTARLVGCTGEPFSLGLIRHRDTDLQGCRIQLRHSSVSSESGVLKPATAGVWKVDVNRCRTADLLKQGIPKHSKSFVGSLSLVPIEGFASSSEAGSSAARDQSIKLLYCCRAELEKQQRHCLATGARLPDLMRVPAPPNKIQSNHKVSLSEIENCVESSGVTFLTSHECSNACLYMILIMLDENEQVIGLDVDFGMADNQCASNEGSEEESLNSDILKGHSKVLSPLDPLTRLRNSLATAAVQPVHVPHTVESKGFPSSGSNISVAEDPQATVIISHTHESSAKVVPPTGSSVEKKDSSPGKFQVRGETSKLQVTPANTEATAASSTRSTDQPSTSLNALEKRLETGLKIGGSQNIGGPRTDSSFDSIVRVFSQDEPCHGQESNVEEFTKYVRDSHEVIDSDGDDAVSLDNLLPARDDANCVVYTSDSRRYPASVGLNRGPLKKTTFLWDNFDTKNQPYFHDVLYGLSSEDDSIHHSDDDDGFFECWIQWMILIICVIMFFPFLRNWVPELLERLARVSGVPAVETTDDMSFSWEMWFSWGTFGLRIA